MSDDDRQMEGGPEWERNQAALLWSAATMAGDAEQIALAANRMGDAVVNSVASRMIDGLLTTFKALVTKQTAERDLIDHERDKIHTARWDYTLTQLDKLLKRGDAQADLFGKLDGLPGAIEAMALEEATRLGKIEERLDRKHDQLEDHRQQIAHERGRNDDHERRLRIIEQQLGLGSDDSATA